MENVDLIFNVFLKKKIWKNVFLLSGQMEGIKYG